MKATLLLAALAVFPLALVDTAAADLREPPAPYCVWNHDVVRDQYVTYNGFTWFTVGVRFVDGSPMCRVQVVCYGEYFECLIPPLP